MIVIKGTLQNKLKTIKTRKKKKTQRQEELQIKNRIKNKNKIRHIKTEKRKINI